MRTAKTQITMKRAESIRPNIIKIGYCQAQNLLRYSNAAHYTAGIYGWKCAVYLIDDQTAILTGYDCGSAKRGIRPPVDEVRALDNQAREVQIACGMDTDRAKAETESLLAELIRKDF